MLKPGRAMWVFIGLALVYISTLIISNREQFGGASVILTIGFLLLAFYCFYSSISTEDVEDEDDIKFKKFKRIIRKSKKYAPSERQQRINEGMEMTAKAEYIRRQMPPKGKGR